MKQRIRIRIPRRWLFWATFVVYAVYWYALAPHVRQDSPRLRRLFILTLSFVDVADRIREN